MTRKKQKAEVFSRAYREVWSKVQRMLKNIICPLRSRKGDKFYIEKLIKYKKIVKRLKK